MKIIHGIMQGTPEWKALRAKYPCASEAPIIMGASRHMTRGEMLRLKAAGMEKEFSDYVQRMVLAKGHAVEGPARAITEQQLGEKLYPMTAVDDAGEYLASLDGCTMAEDWLMEHKQWSEELAAAIRAGATEFPDGQEWQLEQQLIVAESAEKVIFVCSDGTQERRVQMEYRRVPGRAEQLKAGWKQFQHDLEHGDHTPAPPKAVAAPMETLPAVQVRMDGTLSVVSNLDALAPLLRQFIDRIPVKPTTDEDFATTDAACKALKKLEEALDSAETLALASMESVEKMQRLKATLHKLARDTRLQREKLVEARKLEIRTEEIGRGKQALAAHIQGLNSALGGAYMPDVPADFAGKIKGLRTVQSVRDAIDQELARAKIAANDAFLSIQSNLNTLRQYDEHRHLFPDVAAIVQKKPEDLQAVVAARIAAHRAAEEKRLAAERERIRAEESARLEREQRQREEAARREQEAAARRQREEQEAAQRRELIEAQERRQQEERAALHATSEQLKAAALPLPELPPLVDNVVPMPTKAPAGPPSMKLGDVKAALAPLTIDAAGLAALGFPAAGRDGAALLFHAADLPRILNAAIAHLAKVRDQLQKAA